MNDEVIVEVHEKVSNTTIIVDLPLNDGAGILVACHECTHLR